MLKKDSKTPTFIPMGGSTSPELFYKIIGVDWLTSKQAAQYLGLTENALRIMVCRGQVSYYKFGRRLRFRQDDLRALLTPKGVNE